MVISGVLHDIFVLRSEHGKQYDRDLLRLLMDGHILITCGLIQVIAGAALPEASWAYVANGVASVSLLIYCVMIYPFLKSFFTMILNVMLLILLLVR
jgi:hypothetical protein